MDKTMIKRMLRGMAVIFVGGVLLRNTAGCTDAGKEEKIQQDEVMPENAVESENVEENYVSNQIIGSEVGEGISWESLLYQRYEHELYESDEYCNKCALLGENGWEHAQDCYREIITESILGEVANRHWRSGDTPGRMFGVLAAEEQESEGADIGFGMRIVISESGEIREYFYYDFSNSMYNDEWKYIACRENGTKKEDVAEYYVCRETLYYTELSMYESESIWEENVNECAKKIEGEITEYCAVDNRIFRIDREEKLLFDVTDQLDVYMVRWLECEAERVFYEMKVTPEAVEKVTELLPDGYCLKGDNYVAVCDLNHDGMEDYVAIVCHEPVAYEGYYITSAGDMWLFLSNGIGGYERKTLVKGLNNCLVKFVADGVLMCRNETGFEFFQTIPWDYFVYDRGDKDFYIGEAWQCKESTVLMESRETIGEIAIGDYYRQGFNDHGLKNNAIMNTGRWYMTSLEDGGNIWFHDHAWYKSVDREIEQFVNDEMFRIENILAEGLRLHFDEINSIIIHMDISYLSPRIFSGYISGDVKSETEQFGSCMSVMIDTESGEMLDIIEMISKEEMLRICRLGMKDEWRNVLPEEDAERVLRLIEEEYEDACRVTSSGEVLLSVKERRICFSITDWGVWVWGNDEDGVVNAMMDKEYFFHTPLWYYMEPDYTFLSN